MTRIGAPRCAEDSSVQELITWFASFQCDNCGYFSIGKLMLYDDTVDLGARLDLILTDDERADRAKAAAIIFDSMDAIIDWYPETAIGKKYDYVDNDTVKDSASEAHECYSIRAYRASILMARAVCEAIAKDKGCTRGNLQKKIAQMEEQKLISPLVRKQADEIRYFGNDMAHGDFAQQVSADDAHEVLDFMDVLIDEVYQQPAKLYAMQESRARRKNLKVSFVGDDFASQGDDTPIEF